VDLLQQHHEAGRRFEPDELIVAGARVAVGLARGDYKVFTFRGEHAVLLQDCIDRDDALRQLAAG